MRTVGRRAKLVAAGIGGGAAAVFLYLKNPVGVDLIPPCPFRAATGWYCPGCGSLRGLHELLHVHVLDAVQYNILMVASLPLLGVLFAYDAAGHSPRIRPAFVYVYFGMVIAYWVARNLPWFPFKALAPAG